MNFEQVPGYEGLHELIAVRDCYKIHSLVFPPDVVFDIGANIGVFTHYSRERFPDALIVAVEPHPENFAALQEHAPQGRVVVLNKAIGKGEIWRYPDVNSKGKSLIGSGEGYHSEEFGSGIPDLGGHPVESTSIESVMLDDLYAEYVRPGQQFAVKIDCEGAENLLFAHEPSVEVLRKADFVTMELHPYWKAGLDHTDKAIADDAVAIFRGTHRVDSEPPLFFAWRKPDNEPICSRAEFGKLLAERGLLGNLAEIGVATGNFSRDMLNWGAKHVLMVDPWRELPPPDGCGISDEQHEANYQESLAKIGECKNSKERTTILRMLSVEAAAQIPDESLEFCYIDAQHLYHGISVDLEAWWPKVKSDGILAGHDYLGPGLDVNRAVTDFAAKRNLHVHVAIEHQRDASFWIDKP